MRLMQQHGVEGPGLITVKSPDLTVRITVDPTATHRSVDILADRGLAAFCASGKRGDIIPGVRKRNERGEPIPGTVVHDLEMRIEVGRPGVITSLLGTLGLRSVSSISGGGSVVSAGRGAIVSGGNITNCSTGRNSRVTIGKGAARQPEVGVNITAPLNCQVQIKSAPSVVVLLDGVEHTLEAAHQLGFLKKV